jgi:hypothetical protein
MKQSINQSIDGRKACLGLWLAMLDHELEAGEYEGGIISALALLGLNPGNEGWSPAMEYTTVLSAVATITSGLVVYRAWLTQQSAIQAGVEEGIEEGIEEKEVTAGLIIYFSGSERSQSAHEHDCCCLFEEESSSIKVMTEVVGSCTTQLPINSWKAAITRHGSNALINKRKKLV